MNTLITLLVASAVVLMVQGDAQETRDYVRLQVVDAHHRSKRKVILFDTHTTYKWPKNIPFYIERWHFTALDIQMIRSVLRYDFQAHTCLSFTEETTTPPVGQQYIHFRHNDNDTASCKAYIGMNHDSRTFHGQPIYLGSQCFQYRGTLIYMIASTLGMYGEVKRPDRASYVDIFRNNIAPSGLPAFAMESNDSATTHNVPYDYGSAMHMGAKEWLNPEISEYSFRLRAFSVLPKDRRYSRGIGQKSEFSFYDLMALNKAYCPDACRNGRQVYCQNGGFQDPRNCGQCKCADGFEGRLCSEVAEGSQLCTPSSGELPVVDTMRCVKPPNYDSSRMTYDYGDSCTWILRAPRGRRIDAWFTDLDLPSYGTGFRPCLHWVEIKDEGSTAVRGPRYCNYGGNDDLGSSFNWGQIDKDFAIPNISNPITSTASEMMVIFKAPDFKGSYQSPQIGLDYPSNGKFRLCYKISSQLVEDSTERDRQPKQEPQTHTKSDNSNTLLYIGVGVGLLFLILIILILVLIFCVYRRKKRRTPPPSPQPNIQVAYVNPGYGASNAVRISNVYQNIEIESEKKNPDGLDFSHVGHPGGYPQFMPQFQAPPEYEEVNVQNIQNSHQADGSGEVVYTDARSSMRDGSDTQK